MSVVVTGGNSGQTELCTGGSVVIASTWTCCQPSQFPLMCPPILGEALLPEEFGGAMTMANAILAKRKTDNDGCFFISLFFGPGCMPAFLIGASINDCNAVNALQNQAFATWQSKGIQVTVSHCCDDFTINVTVPAGIPKAKRVQEQSQTVIVKESGGGGSSATDAAMTMMMMQQAQMGNMAMMNQQNQMNMQNQQMMQNQAQQQSMNQQMMMNNQNQQQQNSMVQNQMLLNNQNQQNLQQNGQQNMQGMQNMGGMQMMNQQQPQPQMMGQPQQQMMMGQPQQQMMGQQPMMQQPMMG